MIPRLASRKNLNRRMLVVLVRLIRIAINQNVDEKYTIQYIVVYMGSSIRYHNKAGI